MTTHPLYFTFYWRSFCHHIHCIDDITPTVFMRSHPLYMSTSYPLYTTTYSLYLYHHSHCTCVSHPLFPWYHTLCIYDIKPTIFDTTASASVWSHPLCWWYHKIYGSHHTWHPYDIIHTLYHVSFTLYDINPQYLWHHKHCIHDIRSLYMASHPLFRISHHFMYDIKSTVSDLTSTVSVSSHPPYRWHHSQNIDGIASSISLILYPLCLWHNIR